jgi:hypothetical protein
VRAGSLSDPRVVALLKEHFVCVHMTELVTRHLIPDADDLALLEKYERQLREKRPAFLTPSLEGGEREVFFTPDGKLLDIFLSLNAGEKGNQQYTLEGRRDPTAAVRRFFRGAERALQETHGKLPADFGSLRNGSSPAVAAARKATIVLPGPDADHMDLRVWVRNDLLMYDGLVAFNTCRFTHEETRRLLPAKLAKGTTTEWPIALFRRFGHATYPRGAGVLLSLEDGSITGKVRATVKRVSGNLVSGTLRGNITLKASTEKERGYRKHYRPFRSAEADLVGDFTWNTERRSFESLRLVSKDGTGRYAGGYGKLEGDWTIGAALVLPRRQCATGGR